MSIMSTTDLKNSKRYAFEACTDKGCECCYAPKVRLEADDDDDDGSYDFAPAA